MVSRTRSNQRSHHDVAHLHHLTNLPTKYQLSTLYRQNFKGQGHYSKIKGQIKVTPLRVTPRTPNQCLTKYHVPAVYCLTQGQIKIIP